MPVTSNNSQEQMNILILGAGKMGNFFADVLSSEHQVGIFEVNPEKLKFTYNVHRFCHTEEVRAFSPDLVINAASLQHTIPAFQHILPYLPAQCILSDIASVKTGLQAFYNTTKHPFVSSHPMFGPTFANLRNLSTQSVIIISESDAKGKHFFRQMYKKLRLQLFEYTFDEHDKTMAYSLAIPFASSLVFGTTMRHQDAPGTTFKKHWEIAKGLLSEDDFLLSEILFNPYAPQQLMRIRDQLEHLISIAKEKNVQAMHDFLRKVKENIE